jgi:dipeptidyl aminopeptidase/acylaminoacyl peptidase
MRTPLLFAASVAALSSSLVAVGCDDRDPFWDSTPPVPPTSVGLSDGVAVLDPDVGRLLLVSAHGDQESTITPAPLGQNLALATSSADHSALLVLTRGVLNRRRATDEAPALTVLAAGATPGVRTTYPLPTPLSGLSLDPAGTFATIFASGTDGDFVQNPNELLVTNLQNGPSATNPTPITIRSFGGRPQRISYTPALGLPGGQHRLLLVQTSNDLGIVDLEDLQKPDITIRLSSSGGTATPAAVAFSDGESDDPADARVAVRLQSDRNVVLLDFLPQEDTTSPHAFRPVPNLVDVGGLPTDFAFVRTDGGLRLAALVPSTQSLSLVDPKTSVTTSVALGGSFDHLSVVSDSIDPAASATGDVALVWSTSQATIAVVALGTSVGTPYRSLDKLALSEPVAQVLDVPAPNQHLKILAGTSGRRFFVLDLKQRTAAPLEAAAGSTATTSDDGLRATLLANGQANIAVVDLENAHPRNVSLERPVQSLFEVKKVDGGRSLIAVHTGGAGGLTLLDALNPDLASSREVYGLFLEGHN